MKLRNDGPVEKLSREIRENFSTAYELYRKYQEELQKEGRSVFIDVDSDCEVWGGE